LHGVEPSDSAELDDARFRVAIDHSRADDGVITVHVAGDLDPATAPRLQQELEAAVFTGAPTELILDFSGVLFMDSAGVRTILSLHKTMRDAGGVLAICSVPPTPRRVLEITSLTDHLDIRD
jgi:anti-sigma B factor antagonist